MKGYSCIAALSWGWQEQPNHIYPMIKQTYNEGQMDQFQAPLSCKLVQFLDRLSRRRMVSLKALNFP